MSTPPGAAGASIGIARRNHRQTPKMLEPEARAGRNTDDPETLKRQDCLMKLSTRPSRGTKRSHLSLVASVSLAAALSFWGVEVRAQGGAAPPAGPAASPEIGKVIATVNGEEITEFDLTLAEQDFADQLRQIPLLQQRQALVDALIDLKVIKQAAVKAGLGKSAAFEHRLEFLRERALRTEYVTNALAATITDDVLRKRYDQEVATLAPDEQVKASHILVQTEEEARALITQLKGGADFAAIAKAKSQDPGTAPSGGDLGFFSKGTMVPEFDAVAFKLEPGQFTETPVKTEFGWHIIKVVDRKKEEVPSFDEVKDEVRQMVLGDTYTSTIEGLRKSAQIKILEVDPMQGLVPIPGQTRR